MLGYPEHVAIEAEMFLSDVDSAEVGDGSQIAAAVVLVDGLWAGEVEELANDLARCLLSLLFVHYGNCL